MALRVVPLFPSILPRLPAESSYRLRLPPSIAVPLSQIAGLFVPAPTSTTFPNPSSILRELWDGLLRAVPKKKTTHSKSRHRQMAGKALKDVLSVVRCPSCGRPKRSHYLCPYCVEDARKFMSEIALKGSEPIKQSLSQVENELLDLGNTLKPRIPGQEGFVDESAMDEPTLAEHRQTTKAMKEWRKELKLQREDLMLKKQDRAEQTRMGLRGMRREAKENVKKTKKIQDSVVPPAEQTEQSAEKTA